MKLKTKYKSFVSSVKKAILKLKEKAVLCTKQSNITTQSYDEITNIFTKETSTDLNISLNYLDLILTINRSIQQRKNIVAKSFYSVVSIYKYINIGLLTSIFDPIPKYNIQTHSIYNRKQLFV
ncbi:MAG: hypothetical protein ACEPOV_08835 [Hyphomicrobiales bacterium]